MHNAPLDDDVIAAAVEFEVLERLYLAGSSADGNNAHLASIRSEQEDLLPAICAPATSLGAMQARARAAVGFAPEIALADANAPHHERIVAALLLDLVGQHWLDDLIAAMRATPRPPPTAGINPYSRGREDRNPQNPHLRDGGGKARGLPQFAGRPVHGSRGGWIPQVGEQRRQVARCVEQAKDPRRVGPVRVDQHIPVAWD